MATETQADFWIKEYGGVWRKCRKPFKCHGLGSSRPESQCDHEVQKGERYLDTGEFIDLPNTFRMCATCAAKPTNTGRMSA